MASRVTSRLCAAVGVAGPWKEEGVEVGGVRLDWSGWTMGRRRGFEDGAGVWGTANARAREARQSRP